MASRTADVAAWQPFRHILKFRVTTPQLNHLNQLVASLGVSRSWLLRRALHLGLRGVVEELTDVSAHDFALRAARGRRHVGGPRRGPRGDLDSLEIYFGSGNLIEELPRLPPPVSEED